MQPNALSQFSVSGSKGSAFGSVAAGQRVADELDVASGRWRCGEQPSVPCESECVERRAPLFALGAFLHSQRVLSLAESFGQHHEGIRAECRDDAGIVSVEGQVVVIPFRVRDAHGQRTACETAFEIGSAPVETHAAAGRLRTSHIPDFGGCGGQLPALLPGGDGAGAQERQHRQCGESHRPASPVS